MIALVFLQRVAIVFGFLALFPRLSNSQTDPQSPLHDNGKFAAPLSSELVSNYSGPYLLSVGSYSGDITILKYFPSNDTLVRASVYHEEHFSPSWQTVDLGDKDVIYSTDEGSPGGVVSFRLDRGSQGLTKISRSNGIEGTVSIAMQGGLVFVAAYSGHSVQSFSTTEGGHLSAVRNSFTYSMTKPGPNQDRQEAPHPHQVIIDPSKQFVLAADLGADLLRLYAIRGSDIVELPPYPVDLGSGPRHAQFLQIATSSGQETYLYLANELRNSVAVYSTSYINGTIQLNKLQELDTLPPTKLRLAALPKPTAGEIAISNDNRFLYVSNRNDYTFSDDKNGVSDSIALYEIDAKTGLLTFKKLLRAGGITPRHFSIDSSNKFIAISFQESNSVVIYRRDQDTGEFDHSNEYTSKLPVPGNPVCVQWL